MNRLVLLPLFLLACGVGVDDVPRLPDREVQAPQTSCPAAEPERPFRVADEGRAVVQPQPPLGQGGRVLRDQTTLIALALNEQTVFCSALGYGASFLKVSVPDLDWLAHFDHRVDEAGLPCAAAGACSETNSPDAVLSNNPALSLVPVRVVLREHLTLDAAARTCTRRLVEHVTVQLKDRMLVHQVEGDATAWPVEKCELLLSSP